MIKKYGKYWVLQGLIIGILISYIVGLSIGVLFFMNNFQTNPNTVEKVTVVLIIESLHPSYSFNFTDISLVPVNQTLIGHLNDTIGQENWHGINYGIAGWYIQRIFNATEGGSWHWLYYYRISNRKSWNLAPVGVSSFKLNQDYDIKFVFDST